MSAGQRDVSAPEPDARPVAAIFRTPLFNASETFVQAHAAGLRRYRPLLIGLEDKGHAVPALAGRLLLPGSRAERLAFVAGLPTAMADRLRPHAPALLHAHFATDGLRALPLAATLGIPLVTTLHGFDASRSFGAMLRSRRVSWIQYALGRKRLMRAGDLFLAVSDAIRRKALAQGYPDERLVTHYLGVDLARFAPGKAAPEPGLVLHVGRLVEKKGTRLLIEAFSRLGESGAGATLVIIGDGPDRRTLEGRAAALGLAGRIAFLGRLAPDAVAAWKRRAWLLAAPSVTASDGDSEGLPTVVVESAASGVPVVASDHSGLPEAVIDGRTGFIVPEGAVEPLARRIGELLASADLRRRMGQAARAFAEERFDAARQNAWLEDRYDSLSRQIRPRSSR